MCYCRALIAYLSKWNHIRENRRIFHRFASTVDADAKWKQHYADVAPDASPAKVAKQMRPSGKQPQDVLPCVHFLTDIGAVAKEGSLFFRMTSRISYCSSEEMPASQKLRNKQNLETLSMVSLQLPHWEVK